MTLTEMFDVEPPVGPRRLPRVETVRSLWGHVLAEGEPYANCFEPSYWRATASSLKAGDRVEVQSFDRQVQYDVLIIDVNAEASPVHLQLAFLARYPADLVVPTGPVGESNRFLVRQRSQDGMYEVIDSHLGERVAEGLHLAQARQQAGSLDKTVKMAQAEVTARPKGKGKKDDVPAGGWYAPETVEK